jgi:hypothetical protein
MRDLECGGLRRFGCFLWFFPREETNIQSGEDHRTPNQKRKKSKEAETAALQSAKIQRGTQTVCVD